MKTPYVRDLQPDQQVQGTFLVTNKDIRRGKNGDPYLVVTLADRTGDVEARLWDNVPDAADAFDAQDFVRVKGAVQVYQNRLQVTLHRIVRVAAEEQDLRDYLASSKRDVEVMWSELTQLVAEVANPHLRALLQLFLADPVIAAKLRLAPAAKTVHHAFLGGLLEHILSMAGLARQVAAHYGDVDLDLLMTGVILHDIAKIDELNYARNFVYSTEGQLIGHIVMGMRMIDEKVRQLPNFPPKLLLLVQHLMLSHHGTEEFGSPKQPLFGEAVLLNLIDTLDAKYQAVRDHLERDRNVDTLWTAWSNPLERTLLRKQEYLSDAPPLAAARPLPNKQNEPTKPERAAPDSPFANKLQSALKPS